MKLRKLHLQFEDPTRRIFKTQIIIFFFIQPKLVFNTLIDLSVAKLPRYKETH